jgi:polar amino acid transport system substrate-binding protein
MGMRKAMIMMAIAATTLAACAGDESPTTPAAPAGSTPASSAPSPTETATAVTAADCAAGATFFESGKLTISTSNPAFSPYFAGGETDEHPDWEFNDPYTGQGFEAGVAYAVADRMGFSHDDVVWVAEPFDATYAPGPKAYDFSIQQIAFSDERAQAVDFSDPYYHVARAVVGVADTPITQVTSISGLKDFVLATQLGTTDYQWIVDVVQPNKEPGAYNTLSDAVAAINAGQVDGLVVDLPTALYMADPNVQEVTNGVVVGQVPADVNGEYFAMSFAKDNPLVECVNLALAEMPGKLADLEQTWFSVQSNVGEVPTFSTD